jgi:alpha-1,3/alpha-1,6-mannosyltransferase
VVCHEELVALAESLGLKTATTKTIVTALNVPTDVDVLFLLSVPSTLKEMLLKSAKLLIYTPSNEHFGIVPLEAMLAGVPVLAANTGGPLETVVDGKTGWLCPPTEVEKWSAVMDRVLHKMSDKEVKSMGKAGIDRVKKEFSETKMAERFDELIDAMAGRARRGFLEIPLLLLTLAALSVDIGYFYVLRSEAMREQLSSIHIPPFLLTGLSLVNWVVYFASGYAGGISEQNEALAGKKTR